MKGFKKVIAAILVFAVLFSPLVPHIGAESKVMGGNQELVKGQKSSSIKYESAPSDKIQALGITVTKKSLASNISYPQVSSLLNKQLERSINNKFLSLAKQTQQANKELKEQEKEDHKNGWSSGSYFQNMKYSVSYNQDNILSISVTYDEYSGGAHGMTWIDTYNYNLLKAKQLSLKDVITDQKQLGKVNKYIHEQMIARNKKGAQFWVEDFKSVNLTQDQFYYTNGGIMIIFGQSEYGPFANGINFFKVPYSVFK
ncbi:DUF3298 and DUF4163 domain-containing protein [Priestia endophytica]|uniref:DUF3298 and DUF4163 domain-containing protein n=1 Tax=Priestia endophytica TaxID=135735 RepID=UPI00203F6A53|nr:DUF3298 and DUF4163 domain-containing protein [Priestia endophytica]MCM3541033.1 DUF3298 and DUF4163 domain-containing protein [Priestia endophytica]